MYSYEDRIRAVRLYIKLGKRTGATLRQSRMAMLYGVNANLLRKWIDWAARQEGGIAPLRLPRASATLTPAFVQVQVAEHKVPPDITVGSVRLQARLPNGVGLEFGEATPQALSAVLHMLSTLPCSS